MRVTRHLYAVDGWGVGELWQAGGVVVHHELASPALAAVPDDFDPGLASTHVPGAGSGPNRGAAEPPGGTPAVPPLPRGDAFATDLCERFALHLAGTRVSYRDLELDLAWATQFQRSLTAALRAVPWGEVVSYGELAALAGRPGAARAAGTYCADNRFALIVPCHRVVAAQGIGGYGPEGVPLKRRLLELEGVTL